jgi:hypothetical protein
MSRELSSFSSIGLNNFLFCVIFLMLGNQGRPRNAFWTTLFFQIVLLAPLFVTFSIDTQRRWPAERTAAWPLTSTQRLFLSSISFALNPLFIVLFIAYLFWMGFAVSLFFLLIGMIVHLAVYAISRLSSRWYPAVSLKISNLPMMLGGVRGQMFRDLTATLDFWAAIALALSGTLYRLFAHTPDRDAFPILALFIGIAMSTTAQRMLSLDDGRASLRYRLLPFPGWRVLMTFDAVFLIVLAAMVSLLNIKTGIAFGLVVLGVGRYPSIAQRVNQRRWRFVGGDFRFGIAQVVLGGIAGIGAARTGTLFLAGSFIFYIASVFWGQLLWKHFATA